MEDGLFHLFCVKFARHIWYLCISRLNPDLDFIKNTTIRTLVDSHRNQGILTLLLTLKGPMNYDGVRRHLQGVTTRRGKDDELLFPRLRQTLVTRCGKYAWYKGNFDIDENLILAPPITYRGRPISENNIQEYVSDIVSKYLPTGIPPWQMIIIPSVENQHYILLRLHHVLINDGLHIADLLPLAPPVYQHMEGINLINSPLLDVFKKPKSIPYLIERVQEDFCNRWNEFIYNKDPLEKPELLKKAPGIFQYLAILLITIVSIIKDIQKSLTIVKDDPLSRLRYVMSSIERESKKRQVTFLGFFIAICVTMHPKNMVISMFKTFYYGYLFLLYLPILFYYEMMALLSCLTLRYCRYSNTIVGYLYNYTPLIYNTIIEVCYYLKIIIKAPRIILEEVLLEPGTVRTIPPCGRKVIAWSDPVNIDLIKEISRQTEASETEILLTTISATMYRYYSEVGIQIPTHIPITIRNVNSDYIFRNGTDIKPQDSVSGLIALNLPILLDDDEQSTLENLLDVKKNFMHAINSQPITYLLTILQTKYSVLTNILPPTIIEILLKYLSRKYTISVTEITNQYEMMPHRTTWGQEVTNVVYWRPPQANMSVSLCFNQNGDKIILGVMCDAQLLPLHPLLAKEFPDHIDELAHATGVF